MDANVTDTEQRRPDVAARSPTRYAHAMSEAGLVHIVDDDAGVRKALSTLIRSLGYEVRLYESTSEFLESELPEMPSCLLLDVRMPGGSGLDFQASLHHRGLFL